MAEQNNNQTICPACGRDIKLLVPGRHTCMCGETMLVQGREEDSINGESNNTGAKNSMLAALVVIIAALAGAAYYLI